MTEIAIYQQVFRPDVGTTAQCGLRTQRVAELLIGDDLQHGIVAQAVGIVGIFVASDNLIDALPQQRQRVVAYAVVVPRIVETSGHLAG